jgi:hypothetical protein
MTQTATFPNLESLPNVATQAFLYFSASMGTLTEVDVVTSGSYSSEFHAENLGSASAAITGTTSGTLSINLPAGPIAVTIPSITQSFNASPFDGTLDDGGTSGKSFAPVTRTSTPQTTVLKSPADLAAFTGNFRIPVSVSGHALASASSSNGDLSAGFDTQTSATITIIYHYNPDLPSVDPPKSTTPTSSSPPSSGTSPANAAQPAPSGAAGLPQVQAAKLHHGSAHAQKKKPVRVVTAPHKIPHRALGGPVRPKSFAHSRGVKSH